MAVIKKWIAKTLRGTHISLAALATYAPLMFGVRLKSSCDHCATICCILLFYVLLLPTKLLKEVTTMATAVRITDDLVRDAKIYSKIDKRSITGQIEHWARIGKCAEENPDLTYSLIKDILIGIAELEQGESSEYRFG